MDNASKSILWILTLIVVVAACMTVTGILYMDRSKPPAAMQSAAQYDQDLISVLRTSRQLHQGDKLDETCLEVTKMSLSLIPSEMQDDVCRQDDLKFILMNMEVTQDVEAGRIMRWSYVVGGQTAGGVSPLGNGPLSLPLKVDPGTAAGLSPGIFIDLATTVARPDGSAEALPVVEKLLVKNLMAETGLVFVEVPPDLALELLRFTSTGHPFSLSVHSPDEEPTMTGLNPRLREYLKVPTTAPAE